MQTACDPEGGPNRAASDSFEKQKREMDPAKACTVDAERFARMSKALGHPARVRIVEYLKAIDRCICGEIVEIMPLAQSTVSQHLKILKESGLVQGEVEGPRTCYCINKEALEEYKRMAADL